MPNSMKVVTLTRTGASVRATTATATPLTNGRLMHRNVTYEARETFERVAVDGPDDWVTVFEACSPNDSGARGGFGLPPPLGYSLVRGRVALLSRSDSDFDLEELARWWPET